MRAPLQQKPPQWPWFVSCWGDTSRRAAEPQPTSGIRFRKSSQKNRNGGVIKSQGKETSANCIKKTTKSAFFITLDCKKPYGVGVTFQL